MSSLRLDDTEIRAEETALAASLAAFRAEIVRREAVLSTIAGWQSNGLRSPDPVTERPLAFTDDIPDAIRRREQLIYRADLTQLRSSLDNLEAQRQQRQTEIDGLTETIAAQKALVVTLAERVAMRTELIPSASRIAGAGH